MKEYILKTAQSGFAVGEAFLLKESGNSSDFSKDAGDESARLDSAVSSLRQELASAAEKGKGENAGIYEAEIMLLEDQNFIGEAHALIEKKGMDAKSAVERAGQSVIEKISGSDSAYLLQRTDDIKGLTDGLLRILRGEKQKCLSSPSVIVADELSPAELSGLEESLIRGIVTVKGAPSSHVSILAGNLGIPYLYGSTEAVASIKSGDRLILDGEKLTVSPDEEAFHAAAQRYDSMAEKEREGKKQVQGEKSRTKVCANITGPQDVEALLASGAEGVGLFRTEFLFMNRETAPTEEEQYQAYRSVAEAMGEKQVVIRTMDIGSDKKAEWLKLTSEKNPALGCRGLRVSLGNESLFRTQLRALLRAAVCGNVSIMLPMVISLWEVDTVRQLIEKYASELTAEKVPCRIPPLGVMIETPAAVLIAEELADKAAFFSIGTNDLTQYTLALDREAQGLERYYNPCHESVFRMIEMTIEAGHRKKIPTAICGELAANPAAIRRLIQAGIDELSVSVSKVEEIRSRVVETERSLLEEKETDIIAAPVDGELIPMEDIPDPAFSSGTLGRCFGILPDNGSIFAPCSGTIIEIAETKHAVTVSDETGKSILIHVGIDTVSLGGKPYTIYGKVGDRVTEGQKIMEANLNMIRTAGLSPMVVVVRCE